MQYEGSNSGPNRQAKSSTKPADQAGREGAGDVPSDKPTSGNGAGASKREGGSRDPFRPDDPCADSDRDGDTASDKAHTKKKEELEAQIDALYAEPLSGLKFNFDAAYKHLEVIKRANGKVLLQTFDNNKPRLKQVEEIAKEWNAAERKLAKLEGRYPKLLGDPLAALPYQRLDQLEKGLIDIQQKGAGVYIPFNLMRGRRRKLEEVTHICGTFRENDKGAGPLPIEPTMTLATSPGKAHDWLLADEPWGLGELGSEAWRATADEFTGMMQRMIRDHGSDPDAKDLARVLRLAGFNNLKDPANPFLVEIANVSGTRYGRADLVKTFPPLSSSSGGDRKKKANGAAGNGAAHEAGAGAEAGAGHGAGKSAAAPMGNLYDNDGSRPYTKLAEMELRSATKFIAGVNTLLPWVGKCLAFLRLRWPEDKDGGGPAFDIFHELCARSDKYSGIEECKALWDKNKKYIDDYRTYNAVIGSVFKEAKDNGWKFPYWSEDYEARAKLEDADDIDGFNTDWALIEKIGAMYSFKYKSLFSPEKFKLVTANLKRRAKDDDDGDKRTKLLSSIWLGFKTPPRTCGANL